MSVAAAEKSFAHGVHPDEHKERTEHLPIERMPFVDRYLLPLSQHLGAPCKPIVTAGERVERGQIIAEPGGFVSTTLHSPVTGRVRSVGRCRHPNGQMVPAIEIEADAFSTQRLPDAAPIDWESLSLDEFIAHVQKAGLVGLGGAAFPTHVKYKLPEGRRCERLVINGCECEPYLTCDHRLMVERPGAVLRGAEIVAAKLGADSTHIGVEMNKPDAIRALRAALNGQAVWRRLPAGDSADTVWHRLPAGDSADTVWHRLPAGDSADTVWHRLPAGDSAEQRARPIEIVGLRVKYPQGAEKMLIKALFDEEVPAGKLPLDLDIVVNNVASMAAVADYFDRGQPLIERLVTVAGTGIDRPANLIVPVGTPVRAVLQHCGINGETRQVIMGGPMMGQPLATVDAPVLKGTSGLLAFTETAVEHPTEYSCLRCGRCLEACGYMLNPQKLAQLARAGRWEEIDKAYVNDCMECGSCTYACPSNIPIVHLIRTAKVSVREWKAGGK